MLPKLVLILGLAAIGTSFTLPDGLPNGSYRAYYNEDGEEVHEPVSDVSFNTAKSSTPRRLRREGAGPQGQTLAARGAISNWCGCENPVDAYDTNTANSNLAAQVASYPLLQPGWTYYSVQNTVVAFVCNVDNKPGNVPTDVVSTGSWEVTSACGLFYAGTSRIQWPEALDYGYMNYQAGLNWCEKAEVSGDIYCCNDGSKLFADFQSCLTECRAEGFDEHGSFCGPKCVVNPQCSHAPY
jgi:hypothetical protein